MFSRMSSYFRQNLLIEVGHVEHHLIVFSLSRGCWVMFNQHDSEVLETGSAWDKLDKELTTPLRVKSMHQQQQKWRYSFLQLPPTLKQETGVQLTWLGRNCFKDRAALSKRNHLILQWRFYWLLCPSQLYHHDFRRMETSHLKVWILSVTYRL